MNSDQPSFPGDWPPGCPPPDAAPAQGTVYRIVREVPLTARDFRTAQELGRARSASACLRCGLSVLRTLADARHQCALFPALGDRMATAELRPPHGRTKLTRGKVPTHTTWWPALGVDRDSLFRVVEEG